jgi:hypothetical protein
MNGLQLLIALTSLTSPIAQAIDSVVIAIPKKVTFLMAEGDLPQNQLDATAYVGGVYSTRLLIREVLEGEVPERWITVNLVATSRENLSKAKELVVMLSRDSDGKLVAKGWDDVHRMACVPANFEMTSEPSGSFPLAVSPIDLRCRFVP